MELNNPLPSCRNASGVGDLGESSELTALMALFQNEAETTL